MSRTTVAAMRVRQSLLAVCFLLLAGPGFAIVVAPPTIVKSFSAASVPLNSSATLTFTITNPNGATDLTGVSFNDTLPSGLIIANPDSLTGTCDPGVITPSVTSINLAGGTILAGSSCTFSVDVLTIAAGTQVNTTDPVTSNEGGTGNTATASLDVVLPDLTITKTHVGSFARAQTGATYTITVTNSGGGDTSAVIIVTDSLPAGLTATALSGTNWTCTLSPLRCDRGDVLAAGASFEPITLTVNVAGNAASSVTNHASVSGGAESNTANDSASDVTQIVGPDMTIAKTHTGNFLRPQTGATYTITVTNSGAGNTFAPVTVTDSLPAGLSATAISGTNWTCTVTPLRCSRSDVLTAGNSYEPITVTVNVSNSAATSVTNTATVSGGGELNTANDTSSDVTQVDPVLQLSLQSPSVAVIAGGTASTTFNVIYTGGLGNVTFTCSGLPAGTACSFNPTSVSATGTTPVTLQITTTGPSAALGPGPLGIPQQITAMLALLGLGGLVLAGPKQRRIRLAMGLASLVLLALAGCGGNSVQPPKGGGTPLGAFQVTVTASTATGGATATGTVTLLVQ